MMLCLKLIHIQIMSVRLTHRYATGVKLIHIEITSVRLITDTLRV